MVRREFVSKCASKWIGQYVWIVACCIDDVHRDLQRHVAQKIAYIVKICKVIFLDRLCLEGFLLCF